MCLSLANNVYLLFAVPLSQAMSQRMPPLVNMAVGQAGAGGPGNFPALVSMGKNFKGLVPPENMSSNVGGVLQGMMQPVTQPNSQGSIGAVVGQNSFNLGSLGWTNLAGNPGLMFSSENRLNPGLIRSDTETSLSSSFPVTNF